MVVDERYLMLVVDKLKYTDIVHHLRQKIHKGDLKSKSCFRIEEEMVNCRWNRDKSINERMFTSVPSKGVAVYDPKDAIWFN